MNYLDLLKDFIYVIVHRKCNIQMVVTWSCCVVCCSSFSDCFVVSRSRKQLFGNAGPRDHSKNFGIFAAYNYSIARLHIHPTTMVEMGCRNRNLVVSPHKKSILRQVQG